VLDQARSDIALIVDEVQDAINPRPATPGHLIFIGTGPHRALVSELTARRTRLSPAPHRLPTHTIVHHAVARAVLSSLDEWGQSGREEIGPRFVAIALHAEEWQQAVLARDWR